MLVNPVHWFPPQLFSQTTSFKDSAVADLAKSKDGDAELTMDLLQSPNTKITSITDLPSEILALVIEFASPAFNMSDIVNHYDFLDTHKLPKACSHLVFAAVSSLWRQVVWSIPELWASLFLFVDAVHVNERMFLDLYLQNSSGLPLSPGVSCSWSTPNPLLSDIIRETAARMKSLVLVNFAANSLVPLSTLTFPRLQELALITEHIPEPWQFILKDAPFLRSVAIRLLGMKNPPESFQLPFSSIACANLGHIPFDIALQSLEECPNLTDSLSWDTVMIP